MKINAGCGKRKMAGFVNVDIQGDADVISDLRRLPFEDAVAIELHAYHVIEHFYRWEIGEVLDEWNRVMKPGALLVLELPNILLAAKNLLAGTRDQLCMWAFYGDPGHRDPLMIHRWGYTPETVTALVAEHGFGDVTMRLPQTHSARVNRDMRVEARKA